MINEQNVFWIIFVIVFGIVVGRAIYKAGYREGQAELLHPPKLTEADRNRLLMRATLPGWRRVGGWAAIAVPGLLFWVFITVALRSGGSALAFIGAAVAFIATLAGGIMLSHWFWKPYWKAQQEPRSPQDKGSPPSSRTS